MTLPPPTTLQDDGLWTNKRTEQTFASNCRENPPMRHLLACVACTIFGAVAVTVLQGTADAGPADTARLRSIQSRVAVIDASTKRTARDVRELRLTLSTIVEATRGTTISRIAEGALRSSTPLAQDAAAAAKSSLYACRYSAPSGLSSNCER